MINKTIRRGAAATAESAALMTRLASRASSDDDDASEAYALTQALISANCFVHLGEYPLDLGGLLPKSRRIPQTAGADRAIARR